ALERIATAMRLAWLSFRILLLPLWLSHDYSADSIPVATTFLHADVLAGAGIVAGLAALVVRGARLRVPAGVGALIAAASYALSWRRRSANRRRTSSRSATTPSASRAPAKSETRCAFSRRGSSTRTGIIASGRGFASFAARSCSSLERQRRRWSTCGSPVRRG